MTSCLDLELPRASNLMTRTRRRDSQACSSCHLNPKSQSWTNSMTCLADLIHHQTQRFRNGWLIRLGSFQIDLQLLHQAPQQLHQLLEGLPRTPIQWSGCPTYQERNMSQSSIGLLAKSYLELKVQSWNILLSGLSKTQCLKLIPNGLNWLKAKMGLEKNHLRAWDRHHQARESLGELQWKLMIRVVVLDPHSAPLVWVQWQDWTQRTRWQHLQLLTQKIQCHLLHFMD